ncbi:MAG: PIN domain-containing protein [Gammaproteobacteria bacterium]|nr:PIN domain-containing protein [Gammaproteobacteria bacterium]
MQYGADLYGLLKGNNAVIQLFFDSRCVLSECAVSQITRMELLSFPSLQANEEQAIQKFLDTITVLNFDERIEEGVIQFRRSQGGKLPDAMIAATALCYQLQLLAMDKNLDKRVKLIAKGLSKG